ncbi:hypothetical protein MBANPS3_005574 [Mucor bainieri]
MVEEPQITTNLLKRGNELNFLPPATADVAATVSPLVQGVAKDLIMLQQPPPAPLPPVPEKDTELSPQQQVNRKLLGRHQSITRGTASSRAKAVRSPPAETNANATEALLKRRLSAAVGSRNRKQSLTTAPLPLATHDTTAAAAAAATENNKQLLHVGLPSNANGQRRSSWSPSQQQQQQHHQITTTVVPELPSSPSPSPPPPLRKVFEAKRRASMVPSSTATTTTSPNNEGHDHSSIGISSGTNVDSKINQRRRSSMLLQKRPSKYPSVMAASNNNNNTDDGNAHVNKPASVAVATTPSDMNNNNNNAASSAGHQQQTPCSKSSEDADTMVAVINGAANANNATQASAPNNVMVADEVIAIRRPLSQSSSSSTTSSSLDHQHNHHHHHHHHHHHTHNSEDDHLPSYMRRPICAACNRNVKVTSSSESTTAAAVALVSRSHSTANSSRRSSVSTTATTTSKGHDGNSNKKRTVTRTKSTHTADPGATTPHLMSATASLSTVGSNHSIQSMMSRSSSSSSGSNHSNANLQQGPTHRVLRSHSPTSPIPTRRRTKKKSTLTNPLANTTDEPCPSAETKAIVQTTPSRSLVEKWSQLLSQQQMLLATLGGGGGNNTNAADDDELNSIQQNITKLVTSNQEQYETVLLETQAKILQKFTLLMMQQQQQQQQQQKDALLFLSSSTTSSSAAFGVSGSAASITPVNIYNTTPPSTTTTTTFCHPDHVPTSSSSSAAAAVQSCNWQTKLEYGVTRFKWNMSQWIGSLVGTGDIEEQDFDALGYPQNVIISGICVTTEPGLLPKGLQKYFKPYQQPDQVICHKYMVHLTRASRLTHFQLLDPAKWVQDEHASKCQFQVQDRHDYIKRTKHCDAEFGVFQRRHHCRSCGHVFCQEHSSNKLPLFVSNGQDCGEWARVCDTCFYSRIEPQLLSRT